MKQALSSFTCALAHHLFRVDVRKAGKTFAAPPTKKEAIESLLDALSPVVPQCGMMRLGPNRDGGYVLPDDLDGIAACFSPGVSNISGFELECAERGMEVFMADKSVDHPAEQHARFHFLKKYIGATTNDDFITLDQWVTDSEVTPEGDLLLQMDIEGYEWETLLSVSDALLRRCRILVMELHSLDQLWNQPFYSIVSRALFKVLQNHACVHIHPNNCSESIRYLGLEIPPIMEFTFLRKDRIKECHDATSFPHPLDVNNAKHPTLVLPKCWYRMSQE